MTALGRSDIPKSYDPKPVEVKWYQFWLERGYFTPEIDHQRKPFVIIMPPPNVTGELHLGTAFTAVIEDTMIRWHRMLGEPTLWLPGTDHASIVTQNVVERELAKEGLTRQDLGRERFEERVWQWKEKYGGVIPPDMLDLMGLISEMMPIAQLRIGVPSWRTRDPYLIVGIPGGAWYRLGSWYGEDKGHILIDAGKVDLRAMLTE